MVSWDWGGFSEPVRYCAIGGGTVPRKYRLYHPLGNDRSGRRACRGHFTRPVPVIFPVYPIPSSAICFLASFLFSVCPAGHVKSIKN